MGWSCTNDAGNVLDAWMDACIDSTGNQNTYDVNTKRYFYEVGRERPDGAITGKLWRFEGENGCVPAGSFRIDPDGKVSRGPKFLKDAAKNTKPRWPANALPGTGGLR